MEIKMYKKKKMKMYQAIFDKNKKSKVNKKEKHTFLPKNMYLFQKKHALKKGKK